MHLVCLLELCGQFVDLSSENDITRAETGNIMRGEGDFDPVVHVEPLRVVIHLILCKDAKINVSKPSITALDVFSTLK